MKHVHFLGICGTAMGAVASAMARKGYVVTGTDANVYPPMSTFLESEGIRIFQGYKPENIPDEADLIVIGNAMSRGNAEVEAVLERNLRYKSLPETMKEYFLWGKHNYVVTGTHGKTTTTSMLTWLMEANEMNPSFMIGGIARNLGRGGRFTDSDYCVLEGDEYDTSFFDKRSKFLHYLPEVVIINNIEMDHVDIYANVEEIKLSFKRMLRVVPRNGIVFINADCPNCCDVRAYAANELRMVKMVSVGMGEEADIRITDIEHRMDGCSFTLEGECYSIPMIGDFNVRNAAMATCAARFAGLTPDQIRAGFQSFEGVARRQEVRGTVNSVTVVDDFAHHPTAIRQAVEGLRQRFPKSRVWALFDPRSNTSITNTFQHELADALATADFAVLPPVENYKKLLPEERLDLQLLHDEIAAQETPCYVGSSVDDVVAHVVTHVHPGDVLLVMSNGGFGGIHNKLLIGLAQ
ncbi:MAG: UDP-N-acetylmuramate:L-alanyl-gamma-D-glutamyl-meso-diaminopimelate ligase [Akkermansia sp.]|nr:UDP-N-acetylmuramate:L-alanyl-gamma-D-glutamyl-meso-diaminopimelate ligase [Akkermansia sp.]MBR1978077.1 UDP-N-acetylmuramate:L-alanyl-gamma-D-glutamyl-meso-diaminopimelate ligase [Akkermansia sp.]